MINRREALGLLASPILAGAVPKWGWDASGARFELAGGSGEIQWISSSSFRLTRRWHDSTPSARLPIRKVEFTASEVGDQVLLQTRHLNVRIHKVTFRIHVTGSDNRVFLHEADPAARTAQGVRCSFRSAPQEQYFGLGPRTDDVLSARGRRMNTECPMVISTLGYGMFHLPPARYEFDFRTGHRVLCATNDRVDYAFFFGPGPKEILEELKAVSPQKLSGEYDFSVLRRNRLPKEATLLPGVGRPEFTHLQETVRAMIHAALSGIRVPAIDFTPYLNAPTALAQRARQLAAIMPVVISEAAPASLAAIRERLTPYFTTYLQETGDRGLPMVHPLPLQFPKDPETDDWNDEFLVGDELLVAPLLGEEKLRRVYLPMGIWTDLRTNIEHRGKRVIEAEGNADLPPMFAQNGSIIPFQGPDGTMELHYFPNLGGEFFLYEPGNGETSQFHAAPAGDYLRLEVESKVSRRYEWVVHHRGPARELAGQAAWRHDAALNNLHVTMEGPAGADRIVNIVL